MSRSLLTKRLDSLERAGVVRTTNKPGHRGKLYLLTETGLELWKVIEPMAQWGRKWVELQPEHTDPSFALWAWFHTHLRRDRLPKRRTLVRFTFPQQPAPYRRFWILVQQGDAELCYNPPGFPHDLDVVADSEAFTHWHVGRMSWGTALRSGRVVVNGPPSLARALPTWNERAPREG
jgi:DNA-binding MarR family transcriptional regulator